MHVIEHQLHVTLPANNVTMLIVQPHLEFQQPPLEPFPLTAQCSARMLDGIDNVFALARNSQPHFIVFPEFSVPGIEGVQRIFDHLASPDLTTPRVLLAGISGLGRAEYESLCALPNVNAPEESISPSSVLDGQWVNTSVTFVRDDTGVVSAFVQPKLSPSWTEQTTHHQAMFRGSVIRMFRAKFSNNVACRFLSLICFDWVGRENGQPIRDILLTKLNAQYEQEGSQQAIQWLFVLQHNPSPNHHTFLASANALLTDTNEHPFVLRRDTAIVMARTASTEAPSRTGTQHGFCSLIFSPVAPFEVRGCHPTFATQSQRLRQSTALGTCKDALFREMGECIHEASVQVPNFISADPTGRTSAFAQAKVHRFTGNGTDARLSGQPVSAVVKWANDELDEVPDLATDYFSGSPLEPPLRTAQDTVISSYRHLSSKALTFKIDGACAAHADKVKFNGDSAAYVDTVWDQEERNALHHIVQTLTLVASVSTLDVGQAQLHAVADMSGTEISAVIGRTHSDCVNAFKRLLDRTHAPIVLVTRDDNNVKHLPRESEAFADPRSGAGVKVTDSQTLLENARNMSQPEYANFISELLDVQDRRII